MGKIRKCRPVKLICGFIYSKETSLAKAKRLLELRLGKIDFQSREFPFDYTGYYENELGSNLKRRFLAFKKLINPDALPAIKAFTNRVEDKLALSCTKYQEPRTMNQEPRTMDQGPRTELAWYVVRGPWSVKKRSINIDPGYLDMAKLVLATTKDFCHRIYLGSGIFGEVTLVYRKDSFQPWEWTYPDYRSREYIETFNRIREIYRAQDQKIKNQGPRTTDHGPRTKDQVSHKTQGHRSQRFVRRSAFCVRRSA
ncbi:MAG: DUF4416 family protein [Candidatus Omnitrophica bacterium]|nr:DUF4416 family protein [Candidatus Omnitrophota bacterium]